MAFPEPAEVSPWYLRNITQALALNESTGNVYVITAATTGSNIDVYASLNWQEIS
jgi:hypothetical protein